jgi:prepilin-type N-terminal cleavage/methylation domain-containing protein
MAQGTWRALRIDRGVSLPELMVSLVLVSLIMIGVLAAWTKGQESYFVVSEIAEAQQNVRSAMDFMVREIRSGGRDVTQCAFDYTASTTTFTGVSCTATKQTACTAKLGSTVSYPNANGASCPTGVSNPTNGCGCVMALPIGDMTASTLRIRSDRNDNGVIAGRGNAVTAGGGADQGSEDVLYALTNPCPSGIPGACITRDDGTGPQAMVAVDISGFTLTYFPRPGFPPCNGTPTPNPCPSFVPADQADADNVGRIRISVTALQSVAGQQISRTMVTDVTLRNR